MSSVLSSIAGLELHLYTSTLETTQAPGQSTFVIQLLGGLELAQGEPLVVAIPEAVSYAACLVWAAHVAAMQSLTALVSNHCCVGTCRQQDP